MPYKNKADRKKQVNAPRGSAAHEARMERQRARREFDRKNGYAKRKGKDLSHRKALSKGGSNKDGVYVECSSKNRSRNGHSKK
tara:strand:+ start:256 stop:504 length:249 start_codon:yes stop_codon:yes gene_type:complete